MGRIKHLNKENTNVCLMARFHYIKIFPEKRKFESLTKMVQIEYESNNYQIKHQNSVVYVKYNYYINRDLTFSP